VNRLDRDTSGIVVFAKNEYIQTSLVKQMAVKTFYKEYLAILDGFLTPEKGTITAPIARKEGSIIQRCVREDGAPSITHYEVLNTTDKFSIVKFVLETGRTHQIRVHSAHMGSPILGDSLYGDYSELISRQALHANKISFIHPISKKKVEYISTFPEDLNNFLHK